MPVGLDRRCCFRSRLSSCRDITADGVFPSSVGMREPPFAQMSADACFNLISKTKITFFYGRPDLNRHRPYGPTDFHTTSTFAAAKWRSWSGLSLHRCVAALGAARLVSTPSHRWAWLGITS
jgi:hypothetical protein